MQFTNWQDVLAAVQSDGQKSELFYCIKVGDDRTRFMTQAECVEYVRKQMGPRTIAQFIKDRIT